MQCFKDWSKRKRIRNYILTLRFNFQLFVHLNQDQLTTLKVFPHTFFVLLLISSLVVFFFGHPVKDGCDWSNIWGKGEIPIGDDTHKFSHSAVDLWSPVATVNNFWDCEVENWNFFTCYKLTESHLALLLTLLPQPVWVFLAWPGKRSSSAA